MGIGLKFFKYFSLVGAILLGYYNEIFLCLASIFLTALFESLDNMEDSSKH